MAYHKSQPSKPAASPAKPSATPSKLGTGKVEAKKNPTKK